MSTTTRSPLTAQRPEELFTSPDPQKLKAEYLALTKIWHPDRPGGDANTMAHINALYQQAQKLKVWHEPNVVRVRTNRETGIVFRYTYSQPFELGHIYYGTNTLLFLVEFKHHMLVETAVRNITKITYPNEKFKSSLSKYFPQHSPKASFVSDDGNLMGMVFEKTPDVFLLRHLVPNINKDPRHVAWILNRLYDLLCVLQFSGLTHNNIGLDSILLSPIHHTAMITGWWYSAPAKTKLEYLPKAAHSLAPKDLLTSKLADSRIDLAAVRALGRELMGDRTGMTLPRTPTALFLRGATSGDAIKDYQAWSDTLTKEFGPKRVFHQLKEPTP